MNMPNEESSGMKFDNLRTKLNINDGLRDKIIKNSKDNKEGVDLVKLSQNIAKRKVKRNKKEE